jgi:prepilin-type N-terminal cleavage/methylation domain-containing protein
MNRKDKVIRQAFTLLELILVLAIMVAIAGIAVPSFESMIGSRRLTQSIDKLRNDIAEARVTAMRTGQAQVMQATLQGSNYTIVPWLGGNEAQDAAAGATLMSNSGQVVKTQAESSGVSSSEPVVAADAKQLSTGVQFFAVETLIDSRNAFEIQKSTGVVPTSGAQDAVVGGISSPLLLYPDGSSTTAQIVLVDTKGRRMAIQIRGVTGQMRILRLISIDPTTLTPAS